MLFHEIYGCYYRAVAEILSSAVEGSLTRDKMKDIAFREAFSESFLTILPSLEEERWQLLEGSLQTPLKNEPSMPLTTLQLRWLKAISLDPRIKLFGEEFGLPEEVQPLFTPEDYVVFDKYSDGDPYEDEHYVGIFRLILDAINKHKKIRVRYCSGKGIVRTFLCSPYKLEYSEKDDKFRVMVSGCRYTDVLNIARIEECQVLEKAGFLRAEADTKEKRYFILELIDERNALERVMLHFAHFQKEGERIDSRSYRIKVYYDKDDETEMVIRVLSFGPFVKVIEPLDFVELIKHRLMNQKSCGLI